MVKRVGMFQYCVLWAIWNSGGAIDYDDLLVFLVGYSGVDREKMGRVEYARVSKLLKSVYDAILRLRKRGYVLVSEARRGAGLRKRWERLFLTLDGAEFCTQVGWLIDKRDVWISSVNSPESVAYYEIDEDEQGIEVVVEAGVFAREPIEDSPGAVENGAFIE